MYKKIRLDNLDDNIREIDKSGFEEEVVKNEKPALVEFTVDWCQPCLHMSEILQALSEEYGDEINFFSVDVDKNKSLSKEYNVELLPTLVFFDDGKIAANLVGNQSKERINNQIKKLLKE